MTEDGDAVDNALPIGTVVDGRYRIEAVLGVGGLGVVYRAQHTGLGRPVALKVLLPELAGFEDIRRRFAREAKALSTLVHPQIVAVSDFGDADGIAYLAMELLEGRTLEDELDERGAIAPERTVAIAAQVLEALAFAHERGVLHRDLKPGNIFLVDAPDSALSVKLLDFGLAKMGDPDADGPPPPTLTRLGTVLGTPSYMSPEQGTSTAADTSSDVYSMGVVLFEMLTGQCPFDADNAGDVIRAHLVSEVPDLEQVYPGLHLTPELRALVMRALEKERPRRYANGGAMLEALRALPSPPATVDGAAPVVTKPRSAVSGEDPTIRAVVGAAHLDDVPVPRRGRASRSGAAETTGGATADREARPRRARGWVLGLGALVVVGGGLAIVALVLTGSGPDTPVATPTLHGTGPTPTDLSPTPTHDAHHTTGATPTHTDHAVHPHTPTRPAVDPLRRIPRALRTDYTRVRRGRPLSRRDIRFLHTYQQHHADDPRPSLLLAHDHTRRGWLTDATERYRLAYGIDPASRVSRYMRGDLVAIAAKDAHGQGAADLLVEAYGRDALGAVNAALARHGLDAADKARLTRLARRLESSH